MSASLPFQMPQACCVSCPSGSLTTTIFTPIARWAIALRASSSPDQPRRTCPAFKGQQHEATSPKGVFQVEGNDGLVFNDKHSLRQVGARLHLTPLAQKQ